MALFAQELSPLATRAYKLEFCVEEQYHTAHVKQKKTKRIIIIIIIIIIIKEIIIKGKQVKAQSCNQFVRKDKAIRQLLLC